jgi:hypothetical protein
MHGFIVLVSPCPAGTVPALFSLSDRHCDGLILVEQSIPQPLDVNKETVANPFAIDRL